MHCLLFHLAGEGNGRFLQTEGGPDSKCIHGIVRDFEIRLFDRPIINSDKMFHVEREIEKILKELRACK